MICDRYFANISASSAGRWASGGIYLLHAVSKTNTTMLGDFIDGVRAKGFEFEGS